MTKRTRSNDRAVIATAKHESVADFWEAFTERVRRQATTPEGQAAVDGLFELIAKIDTSGFTLADVLKLEAWDYMRMDAWIQTFLKQDKASTAVSSLGSLRLQSRKHMRKIVEQLNPSSTLATVEVKLPAGMDMDSLMAAERRYEEDPHEILS
jgi:hypothetical protein